MFWIPDEWWPNWWVGGEMQAEVNLSVGVTAGKQRGSLGALEKALTSKKALTSRRFTGQCVEVQNTVGEVDLPLHTNSFQAEGH